MGKALLILVEMVAWGFGILLIGGLVEAFFARIRRRHKQTVL